MERRRIRELLILQKKVDVFKFYSGSLVLSCMELYVKLSSVAFLSGWRAISTYSSLQDVKQAFRSKIVLTPPKLSVSMLCVRLHLGFFLYSALWFLKRLKKR